jgi:alpha-D-ribose 1-methylphosphonate 5-triphosphate diphosphatase
MSVTDKADETGEELVITNGRIVKPDEVVRGSVRIEGSRIAKVTDTVVSDVENTIDAEGRLVMPGIIDLHGDDIERYLYPRDGTRIDSLRAFLTADHANIAAGITTKFHAIAFQDDEKKNRSTDLAYEVVSTVESARGMIDHHVHARCEITMEKSVKATKETLGTGAIDLVSLMCHVPGKGQFNNIADFKEWFLDYNDYTEKEMQEVIDERTRVDEDELNRRIEEIVRLAKQEDIAVASHDDETSVEVEELHERGVGISEYPVTLEAAEKASELEMWTAMGAPNLVKGGSQWGNLSTAEAIANDSVDILCSDYHPQSLLIAPFVETQESLPERVKRVTKAPADAAGLKDRGRINEGARADIIVVEEDPERVREAVVAGEHVYKSHQQSRGEKT